ncbi:hypothetical protein [Parasitella parasitica]|uniref:Reverse transcriptase domain-containing protein n=1 Tax=Parasitella parasitica TaxID=35722 RepID=A0A0B7NE04_9FUNG|nr:hypothetical protein [Parasitella parasitica]
MKGRFIGENGLILHLLLHQARYRQYPGIGMLLDQEKAYDRTVFQQRVSPLLFNLALEPFLLSIQQDSEIVGYGYELDRIPRFVKTIAYADDVCVVLKTQDEFTRLQNHLIQYSNVSNAKFNQTKTEAFSLNGNKDADWERYLLQHRISTYHTKFSVIPFRYLDFCMAYTINQRNVIQDKIFHEVKEQVNMYSSRQLSLRGGATVANTLIMSKICLKSTIYACVWQNKRPLVSFSQLCLPLSQGGVGLLQPATQHLVLQVGHLHHVFRPTSPSSLFRPLFKHHMRLITPAPMPPELSFFVPEWRPHPLNHPTSIVNACYKAFDHFGIKFDFSGCSLATSLQLPLHYLFQSYPTNHWLSRHPKFLASNFFIYDSRLRLKLRPYLFDHIVTDVEEQTQLVPNINILVSQLQHNQNWHSYTSTGFRNLNINWTLSLFSSIPAKDFKTFWSLPISLPARNHWYRAV